MGVIKYASKWDLNNGAWKTPVGDEIKRSFGIAANINGTENPFRIKSEMVNYVIVSFGSRIEDHMADNKHIKDDSFNIDKMRSYLDSSDHNFLVKYIMLDADAPLVEDARKIADYVDSLSSKTDTSTINLIGLSKGGMINMYVPQMFKNSNSLRKTSIYNVATPYVGTLLASPSMFYPRVKELVVSKLGNNRFADIVYKVLICLYESISSNSHMDYDIAKKDGILPEKSFCYDKEFVEKVFCEENIEALKKISSVHNFVTNITGDVFTNAIKDKDYLAIGLCILNKWFFNGESDGLVKTSEQYLIENYLDIQSTRLASSHVFFNNAELYKVLESVYENADSTYQRIRG